MGCPPEVLDRIDDMITASLRSPGWRAEVNMLLERRYDAVHRASDWDAAGWGFDPDGWCYRLRRQMEQRERGLRAARKAAR